MPSKDTWETLARQWLATLDDMEDPDDSQVAACAEGLVGIERGLTVFERNLQDHLRRLLNNGDRDGQSSS